MHFGDGANERMMDEFIYREGGNEKRKGGVGAVSPSNGDPCRTEILGGLCNVRRIL